MSDTETPIVRDAPWPEPQMFCSELQLGPTMPPVVMVGPGYAPPALDAEERTDEQGRRRITQRRCSPENALMAADHLIGHALALAPHYQATRALGSLLDQLWPILQEQAYDLVHPDERGDSSRCSKMLRHYIEREVKHRVNEQFVSQREAARLSGLEAAQDTIRRLWAICAEDNPAARAVALAAIAGEVRQTVGRL